MFAYYCTVTSTAMYDSYSVTSIMTNTVSSFEARQKFINFLEEKFPLFDREELTVASVATEVDERQAFIATMNNGAFFASLVPDIRK